jgi:hypothetical protein
MNNFLSLGDITIHRIVELEGPFLPALDVFPTLTAESLDENRHWLAPTGLDQEAGCCSVSTPLSCARRITPCWLTVASVTTRRGRCDRNGI